MTSATVGEVATIFKDVGVLHPSHIPKRLLYRDEQLKTLANALQLSNAGLTTHLIAVGPPGSGKTVTVLKALEQIGGAVYTIAGKSGYETAINLATNLGIKVPPSGLSFDHVWRLIKRNLPRTVIIDEADKMMVKGGRDLLYELTRSGASIVLITNLFNFYEKFVDDVRIRSAFHPKHLFFQRYGVQELLEILRDRVEEAFQPNVFTTEAIAECALAAGKVEGDARYGIDLLRKCGEIAVTNRLKSITADVVQRAIEEVEEDKLKESLLTMRSVERAILEILADNQVKHKPNLSPGELYAKYNRVGCI